MGMGILSLSRKEILGKRICDSLSSDDLKIKQEMLAYLYQYTSHSTPGRSAVILLVIKSNESLLPLLFKLLEDADQQVKFHSFSILLNLIKFASDAVYVPILRSKDIGMVSAVTKALVTLSTKSCTHGAIIDSRILPELCRLLEDKDVAMVSNVINIIDVLFNLTLNEDVHTKIIRGGFLPLLCDLLKVEDSKIVSNVLDVLANLALNHDTHAAIGVVGQELLLRRLADFLRDDCDVDVRENTIKFLAYLAQNPDNLESILEVGILPLLQALVGKVPDQVTKLLDDALVCLNYVDSDNVSDASDSSDECFSDDHSLSSISEAVSGGAGSVSGVKRQRSEGEAVIFGVAVEDRVVRPRKDDELTLS